MPARLGAHLAEVADELVDLAAVVGDERDDAGDPLHLGLLASLEALDESVEQLRPRAGLREHRVALPGVAEPQLDQLLLLEVAEGGDDPARSSPSSSRRRVGIESVHTRPVFPLATSRRRKSARSESKAAKTSSNDPDSRPEAVARVEGRPLPEKPLELEVGQDRLQDERPHVEPDRELAFGDDELRADVVGEDLVEERGDRLGRGRVAEGEVLESRDVVRAGEELADAGAAVAAGTADLLRVRLEALRQVEVVDVADVGLVDAHAEGDRGDDDVAAGRRPPLLHLDPVLGAHAGVVRARRQARRREEGRDADRGALQRDVDDRRSGRALPQPVDQELLPLGRARRAWSGASGWAGRTPSRPRRPRRSRSRCRCRGRRPASRSPSTPARAPRRARAPARRA